MKSTPIRVTNLSDLPAHIEMRFNSKVLNCYKGEIIIPPRQFTEVKIDIYPRKVNPEYRKQISVLNLKNRENDQIVEVYSNNIDKNRVTFHSLFYRILTPLSTNFIDFDMAVLNNPTLRTFTIENITKRPLRLEITSSLPDELQIYMISTDSFDSYKKAHSASIEEKTPAERKEKLIEALEDRRSAKQENNPTQSQGGRGSKPEDNGPEAFATDYLDLASSLIACRSPRKSATTKHKMTRGLPGQNTALGSRVPSVSDKLYLESDFRPSTIEKSESNGSIQFGSDIARDRAGSTTSVHQSESMSAASVPATPVQAHKDAYSVQALISYIESTSKHSAIFPKSSVEEKYVKTQISLKRNLDAAIRDRLLVPISAVTVPAEASLMVVLLLTASGKNRPYIQGKPKKLDAKIFIRLVEFDR